MDQQDGRGREEEARRRGEIVFLFVSFVLVGVLSFEAGLLTKIWKTGEPIALSLVASAPENLPEPPQTGPRTTGTEAKTENSEGPRGDTCAFVGSKNSNKYHLPSCSYAKRILPANRLCFSSEAEAKEKGYTAGCLK